MSKNTNLLHQAADLTETKLTISRDLNAPGNGVSSDTKLDKHRDREERNRVMAYVQLQAREIEALRSELTMLQRKEAPPMILPSMPPPSLAESSGTGTHESILPPIPGVKKEGSRKLQR